MRPFYQQVTWTALALGAYTSMYLVPGLAQATWLADFAKVLMGAVWLPRPQELLEMLKRRKERKSKAPSE
jgi:hypothetical protein